MFSRPRISETGEVSEGRMKIYSIKRTIGVLCFFTLLFLFSPRNSQSVTDIPKDHITYPVLLAGEDLPKDNLTYPVLLVGKKGKGSGFFLLHDDSSYLITARHVLFRETSEPFFVQFDIPKSVKHKCLWQKDESNKCFILIFYGVMSEQETD